MTAIALLILFFPRYMNPKPQLIEDLSDRLDEEHIDALLELITQHLKPDEEVVKELKRVDETVMKDVARLVDLEMQERERERAAKAAQAKTVREELEEHLMDVERENNLQGGDAMDEDENHFEDGDD
jgi:hypothetical protein